MPGRHEAHPLAPTRKVTAGVFGGAITTVIVWALGLGGVAVPGSVAGAITTIVGVAVAYLVRDS